MGGKRFFNMSTAKPLNTRHSRSLKYCPLFGDVLYLESADCSLLKLSIHSIKHIFNHDIKQIQRALIIHTTQ